MNLIGVPDTTKRRIGYSFGGCSVFAEALSKVSNLPAAIVRNFNDNTTLTNGYHAVVLHSDGEFEDVWGKHGPTSVAIRSGWEKWKISLTEHQAILEDARMKGVDIDEQVASAIQLIEKYRH